MGPLRDHNGRYWALLQNFVVDKQASISSMQLWVCSMFHVSGTQVQGLSLPIYALTCMLETWVSEMEIGGRNSGKSGIFCIVRRKLDVLGRGLKSDGFQVRDQRCETWSFESFQPKNPKLKNEDSKRMCSLIRSLATQEL